MAFKNSGDFRHSLKVMHLNSNSAWTQFDCGNRKTCVLKTIGFNWGKTYLIADALLVDVNGNGIQAWQRLGNRHWPFLCFGNEIWERKSGETMFDILISFLNGDVIASLLIEG